MNGIYQRKIQNRPGYFSAGHQTPSQSGLGATA
jgi:hypothetical protein